MIRLVKDLGEKVPSVTAVGRLVDWKVNILISWVGIKCR
jgi:hypothetical protein